MSEEDPGERATAGPVGADPTLRVDRPPFPGRAVRAEVADGRRRTPPVHRDDPTVTLGDVPRGPHRTLEFGVPPVVVVTVGRRRKPRRRHRTWPWILAVVLALVVLGAVLVVMMARGATIDGGADLIGSVRLPGSGTGA